MDIAVQSADAATATGVRLQQVGIPVADLVAAVEFYRGKLGFSVIGHEETPTKLLAWVSFDGGAVIELFQPRPATVERLRQRPDHLAFSCSDICAFRDTVAAAGMYVPAVVDRGDGTKCFQLVDPDGTLLKFCGS